eukprot:TRINITY_DN1_c8_g1_i1.p1 TRINITY_DN1_c8_g1~~TRINITY_DN1_c8_g1_i1.p1  ORF type:complete len:583 (-),score=171.41 TRINITY_DN1_c8_g1_i1:35-1783(-)
MSEQDEGSLSEVEESGSMSEDSENEGAGSSKAQTYTKDFDLHTVKLPTKERIINECEPPTSKVLTASEFWTNPEQTIPNIDVIKNHLKQEGRLEKSLFISLVDKVYETFCEEDNVLNLDAPITICGDVHGQYYDLLKLFEVGGDPASTTYLFLGDYVDRGNFSVECVILLFSLKLKYPSTFFMLRGNHECRHLTDYFTFKEECEYKYDIDVYETIMDAFDALPLCALVNRQFFCVHGGLSPEIKTISDVMKIDRFCEPPQSGPICDLLWADPMEHFDHDADEEFEHNSVRGCSYNFSYRAACAFLDRNRLLSIIRAHEAQDAGYRMYRKNDRTGFPSVITLFSAPNYVDAYNNKGAVMRYENNVINIRQFNNSPHPYHLPGFMNVFTWSMPFVAEKVGELLLTFLNLVDDAAADAEEEKEKKREALKSKVMTVTRMLKMFKDIREEREQVMKIGAISPKGTELPASLQRARSEKKISTSDLEKSLQSFAGAKSIDLSNEARPPGLAKALDESHKAKDSIEAVRRQSSKEFILSRKKSRDFGHFVIKSQGENTEGGASSSSSSSSTASSSSSTDSVPHIKADA